MRISGFLRRPAMLAALFSAAATADIPSEYGFVSELFPGVTIDSVAPSAVPGFLEMRIGGELLYISNDGRFLLQGDMYDLDTRVNLSESARSQARLAQVEPFFGSDGSILFAAAEPLATVTVFTDIDCGYCRKFHREMADYNARGISVRYLFFPRSGPGTDSWRKAESVWCAEDRNDAMTRAKNQQKVESPPCDASIVARHFELVDALSLRGTPAILTEKGDLLIGYRTPDELLEIVSAARP